MTPETKFDKLIEEIHGLGNAEFPDRKKGIHSMEIRTAELNAMVDAFLGEEYDSEKRKKLADLQKELQEEQARLADRLDAGELVPEDYFEALNEAYGKNMSKVEETLGKADFEKLFGAPCREIGDVGDREAFLQSTLEPDPSSEEGSGFVGIRPTSNPPDSKTPSESEIRDRVRQEIVAALELKGREIKSGDLLVRDLGAESIDILDVIFRLELAFDIKIPNDEIFPKDILNDRMLIEYGNLTPEGIRELQNRFPFLSFDESKSPSPGVRIEDLYTVANIEAFVIDRIK